MTNRQKRLTYITEIIVKDLNCSKIRGVTSYWREEDQTTCISFYFDGKATKEELEDASVACSEIIADFPDGMLEENYIRLDYPTPLPESNFWAFKREES